ncbi:hypothetical protein RR46_13886 [Papilio xuthus]|uniref:Uncharacterized protein n=1 Tax=Papilio xuthus TaxID=66420 RepID=A0A194PNG7_PAPXU|nr:hypothetical protein RR46_13886 [Papilio xuthus]
MSVRERRIVSSIKPGVGRGMSRHAPLPPYPATPPLWPVAPRTSLTRLTGNRITRTSPCHASSRRRHRAGHAGT